MLCGPKTEPKRAIELFEADFKLGTIIRGSGLTGCFERIVLQNEDFIVRTDDNDKLSAIVCHPLTRRKRHAVYESLNELEKKSLAYMNGAIGWLGFTVSPFCSLLSYLLQGAARIASAADLYKQRARLNHL